MNTTKNQSKTTTIEDSTKKSLEDAQKGIEINKKTENGPRDQEASDKEKKDEEQWRNEG